MFEDVEESYADGEKPVKYYYNREERIAKAPQIVKDFYAGKMQPLRGFKVLYKNKSNLYILLALIFFVGFTWVYTGINNSRNYAKINNVIFELQAFCYEEEIYSSIKIDPNKAKNFKPLRPSLEETVTDDENGNLVTVEFFFINNDNLLIHKEVQNMVLENKEEYLRTKIQDYDIIRVDVIISFGGKEKELSVRIKH